MENSLIIACIVLFLHYTSWDGEIFDSIKKLVSPDKTIAKPLYGCPICMTPWYGTATYWIFIHNSWQDWLLTVGAAAGLSVIFVIFLAIREACLLYVKKNEK